MTGPPQMNAGVRHAIVDHVSWLVDLHVDGDGDALVTVEAERRPVVRAAAAASGGKNVIIFAFGILADAEILRIVGTAIHRKRPDHNDVVGDIIPFAVGERKRESSDAERVVGVDTIVDESVRHVPVEHEMRDSIVRRLYDERRVEGVVWRVEGAAGDLDLDRGRCGRRRRAAVPELGGVLRGAGRATPLAWRHRAVVAILCVTVACRFVGERVAVVDRRPRRELSHVGARRRWPRRCARPR